MTEIPAHVSNHPIDGHPDDTSQIELQVRVMDTIDTINFDVLWEWRAFDTETGNEVAAGSRFHSREMAEEFARRWLNAQKNTDWETIPHGNPSPFSGRERGELGPG